MEIRSLVPYCVFSEKNVTVFSAVSGLEFSLSKDHRECEFSQKTFKMSSFPLCSICYRFSNWVKLNISERHLSNSSLCVIDFLPHIGSEYSNPVGGFQLITAD